MAFITLPYPTFTANTIIDQSQVNANNAAILAQVNGALDNTNVSTSAAIALTKLGLSPGGVAYNKTTTGNQTWASGLTTDTNPQIAMTSDAGLKFGPGAATAPDVRLKRSAANTLQLAKGDGTTGAVFDFNSGTVTGITFDVPHGGSGAATLTGVLIGNGASAFTAQTPLAVANGGIGTVLFTTGTATFPTAGSIAVVDTTITAGSIITVTEVGTGAVDRYSVAVSAGVGFTVYSSNAASTKVVTYIRFK